MKTKDLVPPAPADLGTGLSDRYVELLKQALTCSLWETRDGVLLARRRGVRLVQYLLRRRDLSLVKAAPVTGRRPGVDWPRLAHTAARRNRLDNLQARIEDVLREEVPGDFVEAGAWRGGVAVLMRGILAARGVVDRTVWVADSFAGMPEPDLDRYPVDAGTHLHKVDALAVPLDEVRRTFRRYGLLDEQVQFLVGWFRDTLPDAPIEALALLRLDCGMYSGTAEALGALYPLLSPGAYCIVDDFGTAEGSRRAAEDYRLAQDISTPVTWVDGEAAYWRVEERTGV